MKNNILRLIVFLLALLNFGFMLYDGTRAITKGDYIRPRTGEYAGQLGPWHYAAEFVGIDPESSLMKGIFVGWGIAGLVLAVLFVMGKRHMAAAMMLMCFLTLWYLVPGTIMCVFMIIILQYLRKTQTR